MKPLSRRAVGMLPRYRRHRGNAPRLRDAFCWRRRRGLVVLHRAFGRRRCERDARSAAGAFGCNNERRSWLRVLPAALRARSDANVLADDDQRDVDRMRVAAC